jgi:hypothetical protein
VERGVSRLVHSCTYAVLDLASGVQCADRTADVHCADREEDKTGCIDYIAED